MLHPSYRTIDGSPNTPQGRTNRRTFIGASEVAAVLGESPYAGPYTVWSAKVFGDDTETTLAMEFGHALEPVICKYGVGEGLLPEHVRNLPTILHPLYDCVGANLDAAELDATGRVVSVIEAKAWNEGDAWLLDLLEVDPDSVPPSKVRSAFLQVQAQIACSDARRGYLIAALGKRLRCVEIERCDKYGRYIVESCVGLWRNYIARQIAPPANGRDLPALAQRPVNDRASAHDPNAAPIFAAYLAAKAAKTRSQSDYDDACAAIRQRMGEAEVLTTPGYRASLSRAKRLTVTEQKL